MLQGDWKIELEVGIKTSHFIVDDVYIVKVMINLDVRIFILVLKVNVY